MYKSDFVSILKVSAINYYIASFEFNIYFTLLLTQIVFDTFKCSFFNYSHAVTKFFIYILTLCCPGLYDVSGHQGSVAIHSRLHMSVDLHFYTRDTYPRGTQSVVILSVI